MNISERVKSIKESPTLAINSKAKELKQRGIDIINFCIGEPDFDTPKNIKDYAISSIKNGFTKYCPVTGTSEIKKAIINKFKKDNSILYKENEIIISNGAKHSIYNIFQSIINVGDEVIVFAPYWVSYIDIIVLSGGIPVIIETTDKNNFKINNDDIEKKITKNTKAIIINSPSNPTGMTYSTEELKIIVKICKKYNIFVISDDIYERIIYDNNKFISILNIDQNIKDKTLIVNGVSKTYSMTGWRLGYTAGHRDIIAAMAKIQSQSTTCVSSISIKASSEALSGTQEYVKHMVQEFEKRRNYIFKELSKISGISCKKPNGSFYVFPNIVNFINKSFNGNKIKNDIDLSNYLLDTANIAVIPGSAFGANKHIRLSFATSIPIISEGIKRLKSALMLLK
ncbi:MAG: pyridoxal phosphate-dependent aminotransferase [Endomicrobium sp.]|jgi:aspartate aminotransferase|nr:pyridoxal phosphate-dependent aminotransferase [Endomicrobium sp.]